MRKKVMTVDDSATVRHVLQTTLSSAGYEVIEACDGTEAIDKLACQPIDMLVTDLNMPNKNGIDLIRHVRQQPGHRFLPIIMLTTECQHELKTEGKEAGASGWVTKPFKPEQLLSVIRMVCPA